MTRARSRKVSCTGVYLIFIASVMIRVMINVRPKVLRLGLVVGLVLGLIIPTLHKSCTVSYLAMQHIWHDTGS